MRTVCVVRCSKTPRHHGTESGKATRLKVPPCVWVESTAPIRAIRNYTYKVLVKLLLRFVTGHVHNLDLLARRLELAVDCAQQGSEHAAWWAPVCCMMPGAATQDNNAQRIVCRSGQGRSQIPMQITHTTSSPSIFSSTGCDAAARRNWKPSKTKH